MRIFSQLAVLLSLLGCAVPAFAQTPAQSSPEDRQRLVSIVRSLERTPLEPSLRSERAWAIQWLTDAPDVSVTMCADPLGGIPDKAFVQGPEIIVQYMLGMAAFLVENPGKSNDADAQQLAGVESALAAYRSIRAVQPSNLSPQLEKLLARQSRGELPGFVHKAYLQCLKKG